MTIRALTIVTAAAVMLGASSAVAAQSRVDRAFTATGTSCDQITWSQESLAAYPNIASACREVVERDGRYYVKFEGKVRRTANRGQELTVDFADGSELTLTPPENLSLYMGGRRTSVGRLRRGDQLTFYVPENQLAAHLAETDSAIAETQQVPIRIVRVTTTQPQATAAVLPETASLSPLLVLLGFSFVALGAALTTHRNRLRN